MKYDKFNKIGMSQSQIVNDQVSNLKVQHIQSKILLHQLHFLNITRDRECHYFRQRALRLFH